MNSNESKRKRILWLSHVVPFPPKGGLLQRSFNLIAELARSHDVFVVAFNQESLLNGSLPGQQDPLQHAIDELLKFLYDVRVVPIPLARGSVGKMMVAMKTLFSSRGYSIDWLKSQEYSDTVARVKNEFKPDAIIFDTISLCIYQPLLQGIPSILDHHNVESSMMMARSNREKNIFKKIYFWQESLKLRKFEEIHCKEHDVNITCSDVDGQLLASLHGLRTEGVKTVPNGVDINFFRPDDIVKIPNSLVFAGGLSWYPNLDAMRYFKNEIWPKLTEKEPDTTMTLLGRNPSPEFTCFGDARFKVAGFVDDVRPYMASALCYICPIRDGGGTKLKILDALAMGCVIVAHPFACTGIDVIPEEHVLFAETVDQFVSQILRVFRDESLRKRISNASRKLAVQEYSFDMIGKRFSDIVTDL